ncbi:MAG: hypothetical protein DHS20C11_22610 [Lysobacteraceae bacterium]|nr:MAG: hypothetical protein DHS20C11_22610 [Xanthomonadaceae bacterium]
MLKPTALILLIFSATSTANDNASNEPSIKDLDILIGKWRYVDEATELAGFDYHETGETECAYALDGAYIRCQGTGVYNGKQRTFVEFLNYNRFTEEFQRVGMFGNHPAIASFTLEISDDGKRIEQRGKPMPQRDGTYTRNWGVITFVDDNHYTWDVHVNRSNEAPNHWPRKFVSQFERVVESDDQN